VICDVEVLETLPLRERRAGMAEIVKSAWLDSEQAVAALERDAAALHAGEREATERAIRRSIALKARVVRDDELEAGGRMALNLGHTVGHALEARGAYRQLRHGEAVALGMVAAFRVASALAGFDRPSQERLERLERLLHALGLPADLDAHLDDEALSFLSADKKRAGGSIHFVRPGAPGRTRVQLIDEASLRAALAPR
ncbi:MAG: 3-dehydroquinate synthase, partial [Myxococcales bacterium]|nr:3-dehydroquinate synthase [Myxococcales bacterium]